MKTKLLYLALFLSISVQLFAQQNPLVGTWEVVSMKGTGSDGKKITMDGSQFKETKIITPTHYILFTQRKQGDSLVFDKSIAGTVRVEGSKYVETPIYFSQEGTDKVKMDFTYRVEGDKFIQSGTITYPDGKKATLDELVFQKVRSANANPANPAIGTWNQLSSSGVSGDGAKWSHTNATHIRFQVITPTHWMRISKKEGRFENAMGGTYRMAGNKPHFNFEMASFPMEGVTVDLTQRVEGDKLYWNGIVKDANGKQMNRFEDVFERVDAKRVKTASAK
jgi:hypothetical protein